MRVLITWSMRSRMACAFPQFSHRPPWVLTPVQLLAPKVESWGCADAMLGPRGGLGERWSCGRPPDWFWVDFGFNLASKRGLKMFRFFVYFRSWGPLGATLGPRSPKTPQEAQLGAKTAPKIPNLEPKWPPKTSHLELKCAPTPPTWSQNGPQDIQPGRKSYSSNPQLAQRLFTTFQGAWPLASGT